MRKIRRKYSRFQLASAVLMVLALLWLTISLPFIYSGQQELALQEQTSNHNAVPGTTEDENANPYGNNTEEKAPSSSVSEEYLHDHHSDYFFASISQYHKCENAAAYTAFHGEVQVPPPNHG